LGKIGTMISSDGEILILFGGSIILKECNDIFIVTIKDLLDETHLISLNV